MEALLAFQGASLAAESKEVVMYRLNCCVAVAVAGLGGQAVAGIINVPGQYEAIRELEAALAIDPDYGPSKRRLKFLREAQGGR